MPNIDSIRHQHCMRCGTELVRKEYLAFYDEYTGNAVYRSKKRCPKAFWHPRFEFDEHGQEITYYGDY